MTGRIATKLGVRKPICCGRRWTGAVCMEESAPFESGEGDLPGERQPAAIRSSRATGDRVLRSRAGPVPFDICMVVGGLVFMASLGLVAVVIVPGLGALAARHPGRYVNIPNRQYWLRPENRAQFRREFTALNIGIGAALALLLGGVNLAVLHANAAQPAKLAPSDGLVGVLIVATAAAAVLIHRRFRRSE